MILPIGVYGCFVFGMIVDGLDPEPGYGSLIIIIGSILSVLGGGIEVLRGAWKRASNPPPLPMARICVP